MSPPKLTRNTPVSGIKQIILFTRFVILPDGLEPSIPSGDVGFRNNLQFPILYSLECLGCHFVAIYVPLSLQNRLDYVLRTTE